MPNIFSAIANEFRTLANDVLLQARDHLLQMIENASGGVESGADATQIVTEAEKALNTIVLEFVPGALGAEASGFIDAIEAGANPALTANVQAGLSIALVRIEALLGAPSTPAPAGEKPAAPAAQKQGVDMSSVIPTKHA